MTTGTINLYWGVMCDPISKQLKEQGFTNLSKKDYEYVDRLKEACNTLTFIVPDSISRKNYEKSNKKVMEIVEKSIEREQQNDSTK